MKKTKLLWILTGILLIFNVIIYLTRWGGDTVLLYVSDTFPILCALISSVCLFSAVRGFKQFDFTKKAWLMIFLGIVLYFIAESIYAVLEISVGMDMNETFPSIADYFWCAAYIPLFIGLVMMFLGYRKSGFPMGNVKVYGILSAIFVILSIVIIYFLLIPIIEDTETDLLAKFFYLFYPIADIFIVVPAILLMYITSLFGAGTISKPWKYLALGFICFTIADLLYSYLSWDNLYGSGNLIDIAWHSGYLLIGLAGLYQKELIDSFKQVA